MAQQWLVDGPRVLDIGDENERVRQLVVALVGGQVDVVTHDDSPTARVEISEVSGLPVRVTWDGRTLKVMHGKEADESVVDALKRVFENFGRNRAVVSISVPMDATATISTATASAVVSGLRKGLKANTVSGALTLSDIHGDVSVNTVSGTTECADLHGQVRLQSVSGAATVQASDVPTARLNTVSGDLVLDLTNASATVSSHSVSGDVTIRAPFTGYAVTANTMGGQVVVDGQSLGRTGGPGPGTSGSLNYGDRSLQVKANAISGNVTVLRSATTGSPPGAAWSGQPGPEDAPGRRPESPTTGGAAYPQDSPPTPPRPDEPPQQWPTPPRDAEDWGGNPT